VNTAHPDGRETPEFQRGRMSSEDKPLARRCVVVTRAAEQASELAERLGTLGAEVLLLPLVEFLPPDDCGPLDRALREIETFDWLLLTSQNAVRFVAARAGTQHVDLAAKLGPSKARPKVAVVGEMTERAAIGEGWRIDRVSSGHGAIDLARELGSQIEGCRVLLPRSNRATSQLPQALIAAGATPAEVVAYRTVPVGNVDPAILSRIERGDVDVVSFASPSAFRALGERLGAERIRRLAVAARLAAIGPTTAAAIRRAGFQVAIEAEISTAAGLAAAIATHFSKNSVTGGKHT
jgi:uroporphyrinogen III methyltransferase/synthase